MEDALDIVQVANTLLLRQIHQRLLLRLAQIRPRVATHQRNFIVHQVVILQKMLQQKNLT
jgi:hypothetical protein